VATAREHPGGAQDLCDVAGRWALRGRSQDHDDIVQGLRAQALADCGCPSRKQGCQRAVESVLVDGHMTCERRRYVAELSSFSLSAEKVNSLSR
jgi:hypothetical protein